MRRHLDRKGNFSNRERHFWIYGSGNDIWQRSLLALGAGDAAGFGIDQVKARASGASHRLIGGAVLFRQWLGKMALNVEAGDRAAKDEMAIMIQPMREYQRRLYSCGECGQAFGGADKKEAASGGGSLFLATGRRGSPKAASRNNTSGCSSRWLPLVPPRCSRHAPARRRQRRRSRCRRPRQPHRAPHRCRQHARQCLWLCTWRIVHDNFNLRGRPAFLLIRIKTGRRRCRRRWLGGGLVERFGERQELELVVPVPPAPLPDLPAAMRRRPPTEVAYLSSVSRSRRCFRSGAFSRRQLHNGYAQTQSRRVRCRHLL